MTVKKLEKILSSNYYLIILVIIVSTGWSLRYIKIDGGFYLLNLISIFCLLFIHLVSSIFLKNTFYTIPTILFLSYSLNNLNLNNETTKSPYFIAIISILFLSFLINIIIHGISIKRGKLTIGLFLIMIANYIPLIYVEFSIPLLVFGFAGIYHFINYQYRANSAEVNVRYYMKVLYAISILLVIQTFIQYILYLSNSSIVVRTEFINKWGNGLKSKFAQGVNDSWGGDFGWGVINDAMLHLLVTLPAHFYFIIKDKNNILRYMPVMLIGIIFATSGSRGGQLGLVILLPILIFIVFKYGSKDKKYEFLLALLIILLPVLLNFNLLKIILDGFKNSLDDPTTGRIEIWKKGIEVFKKYPYFGGGWLSNKIGSHGGRPLIYHSTIIHTLAVMGIFGMISVIINWYESFYIMFKKINFEKMIIFSGFISTFIVGMMDITQHAVFFMPIIIFNLLVMEKANFEKDNITLNNFLGGKYEKNLIRY